MRANASLATAGALALVILPACADNPELATARSGSSSIGPTLSWQLKSPAPTVDVALRDDGTALAASARQVLRVHGTGASTVLHDSGKQDPRPRLFLNPDGKSYGVLSGSTLLLHDDTGNAQLSLQVEPWAYTRLLPGGFSSFVPKLERRGSDELEPVSGRVFDDFGSTAASFTLADEITSRVTAERVVTSDGKQLIARERSGSIAWKAKIALGAFELDAAGKRAIAVRLGDARDVLLLESGNPLGSERLAGPIWNLAMASAGKYAAANSKTELSIYTEGKKSGSVTLEGERPVSLSASDEGLVLLGSQLPEQKVCRVRLFDAAGKELWSKELEHDAQAYRPDVRFAPGGRRFIVRERTRLSAYEIAGGP